MAPVSGGDERERWLASPFCFYSFAAGRFRSPLTGRAGGGNPDGGARAGCTASSCGAGPKCPALGPAHLAHAWRIPASKSSASAFGASCCRQHGNLAPRGHLDLAQPVSMPPANGGRSGAYEIGSVPPPAGEPAACIGSQTHSEVEMDDTISQAPAAAEGRQEGSQAAEPDSQAGSSGEAVAELADTAKQHARQAAEQRKQDGAEKISGLGRAMHSAADELEAEMPGASRYV